MRKEEGANSTALESDLIVVKLSQRQRYVLYRGVLGWGVPVWLLWSLVMAWWQTGGFTESFAASFLRYMLSLPLWLLGGYIWGLRMWRAMQKLKQRAENEHDGPS